MDAPLTLADLPRPVTIDLYNETREQVRRKYRDVPGVVEVLEWGLIPVPGVSDMDFSVLVEPGAHAAFPRMNTYTNGQRWAMMHLHFAVSKDAFTEFRCFDPWLMQNIVPLLHADSPYVPQNIRELGEEERHVLSYDHVMIGWLVDSVETIARIHTTRTVHCREFLETIKGTEYCHRELKRAGAIDTEALPYTDAFNALRKNWFTISEADRLTHITRTFEQYKETISILTDALAGQLDRVATQQIPVSLPPRTARQRQLLKKYPNSLIVPMGQSMYVYQKGRTVCELTYESWKSPLHAREYGRGIYLLPLSLAATQNVHLLCDGLVSDEYKRCIATDLQELPVLDHPALHHRCAVRNAQVQDTIHVMSSKQPTFTYGAEVPLQTKGSSLRANLGIFYDRTMDGIQDTPFGWIAPAKRATLSL